VSRVIKETLLKEKIINQFGQKEGERVGAVVA
jgi:hypothetical protein